MGVVHHSNYIRWFELARVEWLVEHDRPYTDYLEADLQFAVTHAEADYRRSARFGEEVAVSAWMLEVRGASLRMAYRVTRGDEVVACGETEHAAVDGEGRLRRIPKTDRERLARKVAPASGRD